MIVSIKKAETGKSSQIHMLKRELPGGEKEAVHA
jgi:hypothetical protein